MKPRRCDHCDSDLPEDGVDVLVVVLRCGERIVLGGRCCAKSVDIDRRSTIPERAAIMAEVAAIFGAR